MKNITTVLLTFLLFNSNAVYATVTNYDESIQGDLVHTGNASANTSIGTFDIGINTVTGTLTFEDFEDAVDPFRFNISSGQEIISSSYTYSINGTFSTLNFGFLSLGPFEWLTLISIGASPTTVLSDILPLGEGEYYLQNNGFTGNAVTIDYTWRFEVAAVSSQPNPEPTTVSVDISGGEIQECISQNGNEVLLTADIDLGDGAALVSTQWTIDGSYAGDGNSIMPTLGLDSHNIEVTVTTITGGVTSDVYGTATVEIKDTAAPVIYAGFIDSRSAEPVTQIDTANVQWIEASYESHDVCDPNPVTDGSSGFSVANGDLLKIKGSLGQMLLTAPVLELTVTSTDASGNTTSDTATLEFVQ